MTHHTWNHTKWGTYRDPIHKSDLNSIVGKFGCTEQFRRKKEERVTGKRIYEKANGKLCSGNAVHAVIARILRSPPARTAALHPDYNFPENTLREAFDDEFNKHRAGREIDWYRVSGDKWKSEQVQLLGGLLQDLHNHVGEVVLVEAGFIYEIDGVWVTGMTDLVYLPPNQKRIALCDWKTGKQKPHQIDLDHGWESGIYASALRDGYFIPGENVPDIKDVEHRDSVESACIELAGLWKKTLGDDPRQATIPGVADAQQAFDTLTLNYNAQYFGEFPSRIRHVHLRDYIPYAKGGTKTPTRPEELEFYGLSKPDKIKYNKGETRGPAWLHVQRAESDVPRLRHLLHAVVSWIRHGKFAAAPGEMCQRCKFRQPCLNDGYQLIGEEKARLDEALEGMDLDGFEQMGGL